MITEKLEIIEKIPTLYIKNLNDRINIMGKLKRNENKFIFFI